MVCCFVVGALEHDSVVVLEAVSLDRQNVKVKQQHAFLKQSLFFWQVAFKAVVSTLDAATAMPYSLNQPNIFNKDFFSQTISTRNTLPGVLIGADT